MDACENDEIVSRKGEKSQSRERTRRNELRFFAALFVIYTALTVISNAVAADTTPGSSANSMRADSASDKSAAESSAEPSESLLSWLHRSLGAQSHADFPRAHFCLWRR